ncbi:MAG: class III signal peptide-containing protein [Elusimicrobiota bacterium]
MKRLLRSKRGQGTVEYGLILFVVIGIVVVAGTVFKDQIKNAFGQLGGKISAAIGQVGQ